MFEKLETFEIKKKYLRGGLNLYIGQYLYKFIQENNIKRIVETGISWGFSSYYFLAALPSDGELISIEKEVKWDKLIVPMKWRNRWKIIEGTSREKLVKVFEENKDVDLFWHDSNHSYGNQLFEYSTAKPYVRFIGGHDIYRKNRSAWNVFVSKSDTKVIFQDKVFGFGQTF